MSSALVATIRESIGYLQDAGWDQTARLMTLAAEEIERLNEHVRALEAERERNLQPVVGVRRRNINGARQVDRVRVSATPRLVTRRGNPSPDCT